MDDVAPGMVERFGMLEDPRTGHAGRHELLDIIVITPCSVIRGADRNLAVIRRQALNLLNQERSAKVGIKAKHKKAGWNFDCLMKVLSQ